MTARVPQDVDLEDTLLYGLSPLRFGYLVLAALATLAVTRVGALPGALRLAAWLLLPASGAALAWGRWRSRPLDGWLVDLAVFVRRNYGVGLVPPGLFGRRRRPASSGRAVVVPLRAIRTVASDAASDRPPAA